VSDEFRDALTAALDPWFVFTAGDGKPAIAVRTGHDLADAILAMPEIQAIRQLLWVLESDIEAQKIDGYHYTDAHDEWLRICSTSTALAEWVRSNL
jgi:hypothetical protein